jgi:hypothetical protein
MTLEKFKEIKPLLVSEFEKAILKAAEEHQKGFLEFLGIGEQSSGV